MNILLSFGLIFLTAWIGSKLVQYIKLPQVTAYIILGIVIGPEFSDLIHGNILQSVDTISSIGLGLIAFNLGQNFSFQHFKRIRKTVLWISILEAVGAWIFVTMGSHFIAKVPFSISFLLGALASATAPAATVMVIREYRSHGVLTDTLLGVVAIDDLWCLIILAFSISLVRTLTQGMEHTLSFLPVVFKTFVEICGAFLLGGVIAWILNFFSWYIRTKRELLIYTIALFLVALGLAKFFHFSLLLTCLFMGAFVTNLSKTSFRFFDVLKEIDAPIYLLFFVLAGANLEIGLLKHLGLIGIIYILFRISGKFIGAYFGGIFSSAPQKIKKYLGLGLIPQAGVALGGALVVKSVFPKIGGLIFTTIVSATVINELIGPILTKAVLTKADEIS